VPHGIPTGDDTHRWTSRIQGARTARHRTHALVERDNAHRRSLRSRHEHESKHNERSLHGADGGTYRQGYSSGGEQVTLTLGSLFDGIGGFPLAAVNNGIVPLWASEIEPFPIAVTSTHFPQMLHLGDITKLNGAELPPVDIIAGGSPCQDLSIASGTRAGLAGARSGLFMEQIRITKEMRNADILRGRSGVSVRPRILCWENVPYASKCINDVMSCKQL